MRNTSPRLFFIPFFLPFSLSLQVKIWFQNKRSKFKKLMKQGNSTIDANALASGRGLSSGSPSVAPVWSSPTTVKTSVGSPGSYIPSYTSWYPTAHQESMQQSQLMWRKTSAPDSAADGASTLRGRSQALSTDGTQQEQQPRRSADTAASYRKTKTKEETERNCRGAPCALGQHVPDTQRKPSTNGSFIGCSSSPLEISVSVLMWLRFSFLFLPHHPFVMRRPVWRWPEISPRLFTVQREEVCVRVLGGRGSLNQISGLQIPSSGCWNHSIAHCARPQPASLFICSLFVI